MEGSSKIIELMREKLDNAKRKANELGVCTERMAKLQVEDMIAAFLTIKSFWDLFEGDDWSFFECSAELNYPEDYALYLALSDENKQLLRRYVRFFLNCVIELQVY